MGNLKFRYSSVIVGIIFGLAPIYVFAADSAPVQTPTDQSTTAPVEQQSLPPGYVPQTGVPQNQPNGSTPNTVYVPVPEPVAPEYTPNTVYVPENTGDVVVGDGSVGGGGGNTYNNWNRDNYNRDDHNRRDDNHRDNNKNDHQHKEQHHESHHGGGHHGGKK